MTTHLYKKYMPKKNKQIIINDVLIFTHFHSIFVDMHTQR